MLYRSTFYVAMFKYNNKNLPDDETMVSKPVED
jgi:hypothetical protein